MAPIQDKPSVVWGGVAVEPYVLSPEKNCRQRFFLAIRPGKTMETITFRYRNKLKNTIKATLPEVLSF